MLSTKNNSNNSSVFVNTATFDNVWINGGITNTSLTSLLNTTSGNIITVSLNINTISESLNNLTNYISTTISGGVILIIIIEQFSNHKLPIQTR